MSFTLRAVPFVVLTAALLAVPSGCGRRAAPPTPKAKPAKLALPSWAPKHPSPEFLRAAKVLKPVPEEAQPYDPLYVPAWELFGSLGDTAIAGFLKRQQRAVLIRDVGQVTADFMKANYGAVERDGNLIYTVHEVTIPVSALTTPQQRAFSRIVKSWPKSAKQGDKDLLVVLYRDGAKRDLSNVKVGFVSLGEHAVTLNFYVTAITADPSRGRQGATSNLSIWIAQF